MSAPLAVLRDNGEASDLGPTALGRLLAADLIYACDECPAEDGLTVYHARGGDETLALRVAHETEGNQ